MLQIQFLKALGKKHSENIYTGSIHRLIKASQKYQLSFSHGTC